MARLDDGREAGAIRKIRGRFGRATLATVFLGMPVVAGVALAAAYAAFAALPPVPVPPENPLTEEKRVLGKVLFFDEQLSSTNTVSCATCHVMNRAGADPRNGSHPGPDGLPGTPDDKRGSPGIFRSNVFSDFIRDQVFNTQVQVTSRSANSPINAAYAPTLFWDGRASGQFRDPVSGQVIIPAGGALESQAAGPPVNGVEMAHDDIDWSQVTSKLSGVRPLDLATNHPPDVAQALAGGVTYPELFRRAFGDTEITAARISMAIATYQRTLIADQTPWDAFIAGNNNAMTQAQRDGWQAFQASNCALCHIPPLFTGNGFRNIGLRPPPEDRGLQETTGQFADRGKFKVPGLRNVGQKTSFMHTGMLPTLTEVIRFYARAPGAPPQFPDNQDPIMQQVNVPPQAAPLIEDFLRNGLLDPRVRDRLFPFDAPTLASERPEHRTTIIGGGTPGQGGFIPRIIADAPPMIGTP
ncbi:MAG TPA: cytochrome c peroxidase, partial [Phycisphaerales bacterium]|nr:cytochrome c peroxidase [Phycisphaerales bacterium]